MKREENFSEFMTQLETEFEVENGFELLRRDNRDRVDEYPETPHRCGKVAGPFRERLDD